MGNSWEMLPFVENCLLLQALFLNLLWIMLFWGWTVSARKYPGETLGGGSPGAGQWGLAVLAWLVTFGVSVYDFEPNYWLLGFAIANGAFLSVLNPAQALCFSISMVTMRPWEIMPASEFILEMPRFSMFFSIGWAFFYFFVVDRFRVRRSRVLLILVVYMAWVMLSTFITPDPSEARRNFAETMGRSFVIFALIYHLIRDRYSVWALKTTLVVIFTCVGLISLVFYFSGYTDGGRIIAFGAFKNTNDIAAVMAMLIPLALGPWLRKAPSLTERATAVVPVIVSFLVIGLSQSRGAFFSLAAAVGAHALMKIKRKSLAVVAIVVIIGTGQFATTFLNRNAGDLEGSTNSRKSFWISGVRMALYNPVIGVGFNQFPANFEKYAHEITDEYGEHTAHSSWILALAETGPIGLLLFLALYYFGAIRAGIRMHRVEPEWLYTAACYGTAMTFLSHTYVLFPYIFIAAASVAARAIEDARGVPAEEPLMEMKFA